MGVSRCKHPRGLTFEGTNWPGPNGVHAPQHSISSVDRSVLLRAGMDHCDNVNAAALVQQVVVDEAFQDSLGLTGTARANQCLHEPSLAATSAAEDMDQDSDAEQELLDDVLERVLAIQCRFCKRNCKDCG